MTLVAEAFAPLQLLRLAAEWWSLPKTTTIPRRVIVVPGLGMDDTSTMPIRWFLRGLGHQCDGWGLGINGFEVRRSVSRLVDLIDSDHSESICLVGWSLGGVISVEAARARPNRISQVTTFGAGPPHADTSLLSRVVRSSLHGTNRRSMDAVPRPIRCPVYAISSPNDAFAPPSLASTERNVVQQRVKSPHVGMGWDPDVWRLVAANLDTP